MNAVRWTNNAWAKTRDSTVLITGASSGLGLELGRQALRHGVSVIGVVRDTQKLERAVADLPLRPGQLRAITTDLARQESVRALAQTLHTEGKPIDAIVNNAGVPTSAFALTEDGINIEWAVNHINHFLLNALLFPLLSSHGRIVSVGSGLYRAVSELDMDGINLPENNADGKTYGRTKFATAAYSAELSRRLRTAGSTRDAILVHPGLARTSMSQKLQSPLQRLLFGTVSAVIGRSARSGAEALAFGVTGGQAPPETFVGPTLAPWDSRIHFEPITPAAVSPSSGGAVWLASERYTDTVFTL